MSAFFVGADHINAMLTAAAALNSPIPTIAGTFARGSDADLTEIGKALLAENVASLRYRYPDDWQELVDLDINKFIYDEDGRFSIRPNLWASAIQLCECYEYQSCEHDGWQRSYAWKFCAWLARSAAGKTGGDVKGCWPYERDRSQPPVIRLSRLPAAQR